MTQLLTTTQSFPGIYPLIVHLNPPQAGRGKDNIGMGFTQHNEQFLVKKGGSLGAAEFIGAKLCDAVGIPACQPTVVTIQKFGKEEDVFGSRIESGTHQFNQTDVAEWQKVLAGCINMEAFSALLAVDLVLGNDDRHWNNWLVQTAQDPQGITGYRLRAMDFSRSWPTTHPAQSPKAHGSPNTWNAVAEWRLLGVTFNQQVFMNTCGKILDLPAHWLRRQVLQQISGVFVTPDDVDQYCQWWEHHLKNQVDEAMHSLLNGGWP